MKLGLHDTWILMSLFKAGKQILLFTGKYSLKWNLDRAILHKI